MRTIVALRTIGVPAIYLRSERLVIKAGTCYAIHLAEDNPLTFIEEFEPVGDSRGGFGSTGHQKIARSNENNRGQQQLFPTKTFGRSLSFRSLLFEQGLRGFIYENECYCQFGFRIS